MKAFTVCLIMLSMYGLMSVRDAFSQDRSIPGNDNTLVYSTNPEYPPYDWAVDEKYFDGASIELLSMIMPKNLKLKPVVYPWKRSMLMAQKGEIDLLVSLRITPERSEYLEFTTHRAFPNPIVVFVCKDKAFPYKTWKDLKLFTGGISFGDTFGGGFDEYSRKELTIQEAKTMKDNFNKLDAGRIDYFVTSYFLGMAYLSKHKFRHEIVSLSPPISNGNIHFGISKKSKYIYLIPYISSKLEELDKKGIPDALLRKYLERYKNKTTTSHP
jgi:polar amino acid transport system substrate-binding protein